MAFFSSKKALSARSRKEGATSERDKEAEQSQELQEKHHRCITVEPIIFFMMLCYGLLIPLKLQYLTERFTQEYNVTNSDFDGRDYCNEDTNITNDDMKHKIQQDTTLWSMYLSAASALPAIFTTTLLGAYSDRAGRKIALISPSVGFTIYAAVYLVVLYLNLRIEYLLIAHFAMGISGDFSLLLTGCFSYMADITSKKDRMFHIVILDIFGFIGAGISQIGIGFLIKAAGFLPPYWFILGVVLMCSLYTILFIEDSLSPENRRTFPTQSNTFKTIVNFFQNNSNNRRWRIILLLVILVLRMVVFYSLPAITLLYGLGEPFCWNSVIIGFFSAGQYVAGAFGMLFGGKILSKFFSEPSLMQLGFVSSILSVLLVALAPTTLALFFVILVGVFRALALPMVRSQMSKLVFPSEQGLMFAWIGCMQSLTNFISPLIFNAAFYATIDSNPRIVFYIMVAVLTIASLLTIILQVKRQDSSYMILHDPRENDSLSKSSEIEKSYGNVTTQRR